MAQGDVGLQFINSLAQYTAADVAASSDPTGAAALGGDWALEQTAGNIETSALQGFGLAGLLATNTAPTISISTLSTNPTYTFTANQGALMLGRVQIRDAELSAANNYNGATLTISRHGGANPDDVFLGAEIRGISPWLVDYALISGSYLTIDGKTIGRVMTNSGGTLTLAFNSNATESLFTTAIARIAYVNTGNSGTPAPAVLELDWTFSDGNTGAQGAGGALSVTGTQAYDSPYGGVAPTLAAPLPDVSVAIGAPLNFTFSATAFTDANAGTTLAYSIGMADGSVLLPWLYFNATTRTFSGTPGAIDTGAFDIQVTATDRGGASASDVFRLTVAAPDTQAPTVANFSPSDEATGVAIGSNIVLTFNEAIAKGAGNITLKNAAGATIATYDAASSTNLSIAGSALTINPTADLASGTSYSVEFAAGSIKDLAGNSYAGTSTYNFTTVAADTTAPTISLSSDKAGLKVGDTASITFILSEASANFVVGDVTVTGGVLSNFAGSGMTYTATLTPTVNSTTAAVVSVPSGVFSDAAGNPNADGTDANNKVTLSVDTVSPTVSSFIPADEATAVAVGANIVVTFGESITKGSGSIVLKNGDGATIATYDAASSTNLRISGNTLTINPTFDLSYGTSYTVDFAGGVVRDLAGNSFAGVASYNFMTATAIVSTGTSTGKVTTGSSIPMGSNSGTLQADGKMLVVGSDYKGDFAVARFNSNGTLDTSFGGGGSVTTDFFKPNDQAHSVYAQSNGSIVVAGYGSAGAASTSDFSIARFDSNGTLDTSFGGDGRVTTDFGSSTDFAFSIAVQTDGKILVGGRTSSDLIGTYSDFALVRYNTDGSLDAGFDGDGKVTTDFKISLDDGNSVVLQADGKILVAGETGTDHDDFAVVRYNSNGSLDTSFDSDGKVTTDFGSSTDSGSGIAVQLDGKIVVAGYSYKSAYATSDFALARYNTDGSLDTSFDGDGKVTTDFGSTDVGLSVAVQVDGKIVVSGYTNGGSTGYDFALARYNPNGSLDTSFDGDGKVTTDFGSDDGGCSVALQPDGKIVVMGYGGGRGSVAIARYNSDGSLDTTFGLAANQTFTGNSGKDSLTGGSGNDIIDGGTGVDTAVYSISRSNFALSRTSTGFTLTDNTGAAGTDTLQNIERIKFSDGSIALDVGAAQPAGQTAMLLGAVLPNRLVFDASKQALLGAAIDLFDQGYSLQTLSGAVMRLPIWDILTGKATPSNTDIATYLLTNVNGAAPDGTTLASAVASLNTETDFTTQGNFLWHLAESTVNQTRIDLVGLASTGLAYGL